MAALLAVVHMLAAPPAAANPADGAAPGRAAKTGAIAPGVPAATTADTTAAGVPVTTMASPPSVTAAAAAACLVSGDGYFRAHVGGALDARIDWPNSGTRCQGESRSQPPGIRMSFQRAGGGKPNWLFVFGLNGVRRGQPARATGANLTVILQGTSRIFGTLGDSRCTVDSLAQTPLKIAGSYRVEARGFCTQPAHAVHGEGDLLVSTFEFAGPVKYDTDPPHDTARAPP